MQVAGDAPAISLPFGKVLERGFGKLGHAILPSSWRGDAARRPGLDSSESREQGSLCGNVCLRNAGEVMSRLARVKARSGESEGLVRTSRGYFEHSHSFLLLLKDTTHGSQGLLSI